MTEPYSQKNIEAMSGVDLRQLTYEIKKSVRDTCLEDTRDCREFVEWIKTIFIDEWTEEELEEFK